MNKILQLNHSVKEKFSELNLLEKGKEAFSSLPSFEEELNTMCNEELLELDVILNFIIKNSQLRLEKELNRLSKLVSSPQKLEKPKLTNLVSDLSSPTQSRRGTKVETNFSLQGESLKNPAIFHICNEETKTPSGQSLITTPTSSNKPAGLPLTTKSSQTPSQRLFPQTMMVNGRASCELIVSTTTIHKPERMKGKDNPQLRESRKLSVQEPVRRLASQENTVQASVNSGTGENKVMNLPSQTFQTMYLDRFQNKVKPQRCQEDDNKDSVLCKSLNIMNSTVIVKYLKAHDILLEEARILPSFLKSEAPKAILLEKVHNELRRFNSEIMKSRERFKREWADSQQTKRESNTRKGNLPREHLMKTEKIAEREEDVDMKERSPKDNATKTEIVIKKPQREQNANPVIPESKAALPLQPLSMKPNSKSRDPTPKTLGSRFYVNNDVITKTHARNNSLPLPERIQIIGQPSRDSQPTTSPEDSPFNFPLRSRHELPSTAKRNTRYEQSNRSEIPLPVHVYNNNSASTPLNKSNWRANVTPCNARKQNNSVALPKLQVSDEPHSFTAELERQRQISNQSPTGETTPPVAALLKHILTGKDYKTDRELMSKNLLKRLETSMEEALPPRALGHKRNSTFDTNITNISVILNDRFQPFDLLKTQYYSTNKVIPSKKYSIDSKGKKCLNGMLDGRFTVTPKNLVDIGSDVNKRSLL